MHCSLWLNSVLVFQAACIFLSQIRYLGTVVNIHLHFYKINKTAAVTEPSMSAGCFISRRMRTCWIVVKLFRNHSKLRSREIKRAKQHSTWQHDCVTSASTILSMNSQTTLLMYVVSYVVGYDLEVCY